MSVQQEKAPARPGHRGPVQADAGPVTKTRPILRAMTSPGSIVLSVALLVWALVTPEYLVFTVSAAVPVAILGLGLLVLQGWTREISLCAAGLFASAMYFFSWFDRDDQGLGWPVLVAALAAVGIVTAMMAGLAMVSGRLPAIYLVVLTVGLQITIEKTVFTVGYLSGGTSGGNGGKPLVNPRPELFGIEILGDRIFYFFSLLWLAVVLGLLIRLRRSPAGLAFLLVGSNRQSAAAVGIPPVKFRVLAYAVSGLLAGVGGVLLALLYVSPGLYLNYRVEDSLLLLAIPVIAGVDSMASVLVVATYLIVTPVLLEQWHIDQNFISAAALGVGALFGIRGIGGRMQDLERRWRYGGRRQRTRRKRMATAVLRESHGLADDRTSVLTRAERDECLGILEQWLPPRHTEDLAVRTEDVAVSFGAIHALRGASITVPAGQMVGLIGPNGAGKTTLFDVISGFTPTDSGTVELFGEDVTATTSWNRSRLGMARTFQSTRVITELTGGDNICAGAYRTVHANVAEFLVGRPSAWAKMREAEEAGYAAARLLDVHRYWDERVGTLEFSARRRIEIARSLVAAPRLLLLDEPAAGLDPASSSALFGLVRRLHRDLGLTVLIVEHYVKAVLDTCDLVYVLAEGTVLASGTPAQIAANSEVQERYLGTRLRYVEHDQAGDMTGASPVEDGVPVEPAEAAGEPARRAP